MTPAIMLVMAVDVHKQFEFGCRFRAGMLRYHQRAR